MIKDMHTKQTLSIQINLKNECVSCVCICFCDIMELESTKTAELLNYNLLLWTLDCVHHDSQLSAGLSKLNNCIQHCFKSCISVSCNHWEIKPRLAKFTIVKQNIKNVHSNLSNPYCNTNQFVLSG